jgi:hypothetical protein
MKKPKTRLAVLLKKRVKVERDLNSYERMVTLYFNKRKRAARQLKYYERLIQNEMTVPPHPDPKRIVEA